MPVLRQRGVSGCRTVRQYYTVTGGSRARVTVTGSTESPSHVCMGMTAGVVGEWIGLARDVASSGSTMIMIIK
jgi:hypothetical protein